jgi:biotin carboxyl carrier protein
MRYRAESGGRTHDIVVTRDERYWRVRLDDREILVDVLPLGSSLYSLLIEGRSYEVDVLDGEDAVMVHLGGQPFRVVLQDPAAQGPASGAARSSVRGETIAAPMPGKVVRVLVAQGDTVEAGQVVAVVEAMKMENELRARAGGRVRDVRAREGAAVGAGDALVVME